MEMEDNPQIMDKMKTKDCPSSTKLGQQRNMARRNGASKFL